jgi:hypothetical protein
MPTGSSFWIAIYSASLATVLGLIRVYEFVVDRRPTLKAIAELTSSDEIGNTIRVVNSSKNPANIYYFELVWVKPTRRPIAPWFRKVEREDSPLNGDGCDITIGPHSQYPWFLGRKTILPGAVSHNHIST